MLKKKKQKKGFFCYEKINPKEVLNKGDICHVKFDGIDINHEFEVSEFSGKIASLLMTEDNKKSFLKLSNNGQCHINYIRRKVFYEEK